MKNWLKVLIVFLIIAGLAWLFNASRLNSPIRVLQRSEPSLSFESFSGTAGSADFAVPLGGAESQGRPASGIAPTEPDSLADFAEVTRSDNRLIVRGAQLSVVSEDVDQSVSRFRDAVTAIGGTIITSRLTRSPAGIPQGQVTARVPVDKFDQAVQEARAAGLRVADENISGQDVTEQYVDTEARLRNLRASEEQFLGIMERATKIEEVLNVQQHLERVRGQIEQAQAQMQYLERSAKLSTITVSFAADEEALPVINPVIRWRPLRELKEAAQALLKTLQKVGNFLIWAVVFLPIWLPILLIGWFIRYRHNKKTV